MPLLLVRRLSALGLVLAVCAGLTPFPAEARRSTTREAVPTAQAEPETAWTAGKESADCQRSRRKFWIEGEGWVVRTATTCR